AAGNVRNWDALFGGLLRRAALAGRRAGPRCPSAARARLLRRIVREEDTTGCDGGARLARDLSPLLQLGRHRRRLLGWCAGLLFLSAAFVVAVAGGMGAGGGALFTAGGVLVIAFGGVLLVVFGGVLVIAFGVLLIALGGVLVIASGVL